MGFDAVAVRHPLLSRLVAHRTQEELTDTVCGFSVLQVLQIASGTWSGHDRRSSGNTTATFCGLLLDQISDKSDSGLGSLVLFFFIFGLYGSLLDFFLNLSTHSVGLVFHLHGSHEFGDGHIWLEVNHHFLSDIFRHGFFLCFRIIRTSLWLSRRCLLCFSNCLPTVDALRVLARCLRTITYIGYVAGVIELLGDLNGNGVFVHGQGCNAVLQHA